MMDPAAEKLPHSAPPGGAALDVAHEPMSYPCPSGFRPTEAVYGDLFFADRAEIDPDSSRAAFPAWIRWTTRERKIREKSGDGRYQATGTRRLVV